MRLLGQFDPDWISFEELTTKRRALTGEQLADIRLFLRSDRMKPILMLAAQERGRASADVNADATKRTTSSFLARLYDVVFINEVRAWQHGTTAPNWEHAADEVWSQVVHLISEAIPAAFHDHSEEVFAELQLFDDFQVAPFLLRGSSSLAAQYGRELSRLAGDIERLVAARDLAAELANLQAARVGEPIITHSASGLDMPFEQLYVDRKVIPDDEKMRFTPDALFEEGAPFRVVLTGAPGAGKSTLVRHLAQACISHERTIRIPALVMKCREYATGFWDEGLPTFGAKVLSPQLSLTISTEGLTDLLLTGRVVAIFDGLDEIVDVTQRVEMVQRIHVFTARFPALSVLVTSRSLGYERAPLSQSLFSRVRLEEFDILQVIEYAKKWFHLAARPDLIEPFLDESTSVSDIRHNPLLLSLLCILYRESGAIPADRRGVYSECAQLLFHKWDVHRQIRQTDAMPKWGDRIMQDIAGWFYRSQSASQGVEEGILVSVVRRYMMDNLGFPEQYAASQATDFIDFCSERGWLLVKLGTTRRGSRLFGFIHRTFYEFFAAQSVVRSNPQADSIAREIAAAYEKDSTSVLPELLLQELDHSVDRGGAQVIDILVKERSAGPVLALRLINAVNLPRYARHAAIDGLVLAGWRRKDVLSLGGPTRTSAIEHLSFELLLRSNPIVRDQFSEIVEKSKPELFLTFVSRWVNYVISSPDNRLVAPWREEVEAMIERRSDELGIADATTGAIITNWALWRWGERANIQNPMEFRHYLVVDGPIGPALGTILTVCFEALKAGNPKPLYRYSTLLKRLAANCRASVLEGDDAMLLANVLEQADPGLLPDIVPGANVEGVFAYAEKICSVSVMAAFEARGAVVAWSGSFRFIARLHEFREQRQLYSGGRRIPSEVEASQWKGMPLAFRRWANGTLSFSKSIAPEENFDEYIFGTV